MNEKKAANHKLVPEHTIRCGDILISIHKRQVRGFVFRDFTIHRTWVSRASNHELFGDSFFVDSHDPLVEGIGKACDWIRSKELSPRVATSPHETSVPGE